MIVPKYVEEIRNLVKYLNNFFTQKYPGPRAHYPKLPELCLSNETPCQNSKNDNRNKILYKTQQTFKTQQHKTNLKSDGGGQDRSKPVQLMLSLTRVYV